MLDYWFLLRNAEKVIKHMRRQEKNNIAPKNKAIIRSRLKYDTDVGITGKRFKISINNILKAFIEKADSMQDHMDSFSREMVTKKYQ